MSQYFKQTYLTNFSLITGRGRGRLQNGRGMDKCEVLTLQKEGGGGAEKL